jgi:hypothetical protein
VGGLDGGDGGGYPLGNVMSIGGEARVCLHC